MIVGKTLFVQADAEDSINLISKDLLGYNVMTDSGSFVGAWIKLLETSRDA